MIEGIVMFKVIQEETKEIRIQVVPGRGFSQRTIEETKANFIHRLGENLSVDVEVAEKIPAESSGKIWFCVSKMHGASR